MYYNNIFKSICHRQMKHLENNKEFYSTLFLKLIVSKFMVFAMCNLFLKILAIKMCCFHLNTISYRLRCPLCIHRKRYHLSHCFHQERNLHTPSAYQCSGLPFAGQKSNHRRCKRKIQKPSGRDHRPSGLQKNNSRRTIPRIAAHIELG